MVSDCPYHLTMSHMDRKCETCVIFYICFFLLKVLSVQKYAQPRGSIFAHFIENMNVIYAKFSKVLLIFSLSSISGVHNE